MTRSRAADDFPAIRSRMEQLRRERTRASTEQTSGSPRPQSRPVAADPSQNGNRWRLRHAIRQRLFGRKAKLEPVCHAGARFHKSPA